MSADNKKWITIDEPKVFCHIKVTSCNRGYIPQELEGMCGLADNGDLKGCPIAVQWADRKLSGEKDPGEITRQISSDGKGYRVIKKNWTLEVSSGSNSERW